MEINLQKDSKTSKNLDTNLQISEDLENNLETDSKIPDDIQNNTEKQNDSQISDNLKNNLEMDSEIPDNLEKDLQNDLQISDDLETDSKISNDLENNLKISDDLENNLETDSKISDSVEQNLQNDSQIPDNLKNNLEMVSEIPDNLEKDLQDDLQISDDLEKISNDLENNLQNDPQITDDLENNLETDSEIPDNLEKNLQNDSQISNVLEKNLETDSKISHDLENNLETDSKIPDSLEKNLQNDSQISDELENNLETDSEIPDNLEKDLQNDSQISNDLENNLQNDPQITDDLENNLETDSKIPNDIENNLQNDSQIRDNLETNSKISDDLENNLETDSKISDNLEKNLQNNSQISNDLENNLQTDSKIPHDLENYLETDSRIPNDIENNLQNDSQISDVLEANSKISDDVEYSLQTDSKISDNLEKNLESVLKIPDDLENNLQNNSTQISLQRNSESITEQMTAVVDRKIFENIPTKLIKRRATTELIDSQNLLNEKRRKTIDISLISTLIDTCETNISCENKNKLEENINENCLETFVENFNSLNLGGKSIPIPENIDKIEIVKNKLESTTENATCNKMDSKKIEISILDKTVPPELEIFSENNIPNVNSEKITEENELNATEYTEHNKPSKLEEITIPISDETLSVETKNTETLPENNTSKINSQDTMEENKLKLIKDTECNKLELDIMKLKTRDKTLPSKTKILNSENNIPITEEYVADNHVKENIILESSKQPSKALVDEKEHNLCNISIEENEEKFEINVQHKKRKENNESCVKAQETKMKTDVKSERKAPCSKRKYLLRKIKKQYKVKKCKVVIKRLKETFKYKGNTKQRKLEENGMQRTSIEETISNDLVSTTDAVISEVADIEMEKPMVFVDKQSEIEQTEADNKEFEKIIENRNKLIHIQSTKISNTVIPNEITDFVSEEKSEINIPLDHVTDSQMIESFEPKIEIIQNENKKSKEENIENKLQQTGGEIDLKKLTDVIIPEIIISTIQEMQKNSVTENLINSSNQNDSQTVELIEPTINKKDDLDLTEKQSEFKLIEENLKNESESKLDEIILDNSKITADIVESKDTAMANAKLDEKTTTSEKTAEIKQSIKIKPKEERNDELEGTKVDKNEELIDTTFDNTFSIEDMLDANISFLETEKINEKLQQQNEPLKKSEFSKEVKKPPDETKLLIESDNLSFIDIKNLSLNINDWSTFKEGSDYLFEDQTTENALKNMEISGKETFDENLISGFNIDLINYSPKVQQSLNKQQNIIVTNNNNSGNSCNNNGNNGSNQQSRTANCMISGMPEGLFGPDDIISSLCDGYSENEDNNLSQMCVNMNNILSEECIKKASKQNQNLCENNIAENADKSDEIYDCLPDFNTLEFYNLMTDFENNSVVNNFSMDVYLLSQAEDNNFKSTNLSNNSTTTSTETVTQINQIPVDNTAKIQQQQQQKQTDTNILNKEKDTFNTYSQPFINVDNVIDTCLAQSTPKKSKETAKTKNLIHNTFCLNDSLENKLQNNNSIQKTILKDNNNVETNKNNTSKIFDNFYISENDLKEASSSNSSLNIKKQQQFKTKLPVVSESSTFLNPPVEKSVEIEMNVNNIENQSLQKTILPFTTEDVIIKQKPSSSSNDVVTVEPKIIITSCSETNNDVISSLPVTTVSSSLKEFVSLEPQSQTIKESEFNCSSPTVVTHEQIQPLSNTDETPPETVTVATVDYEDSPSALLEKTNFVEITQNEKILDMPDFNVTNTAADIRDNKNLKLVATTENMLRKSSKHTPFISNNDSNESSLKKKIEPEKDLSSTDLFDRLKNEVMDVPMPSKHKPRSKGISLSARKLTVLEKKQSPILTNSDEFVYHSSYDRDTSSPIIDVVSVGRTRTNTSEITTPSSLNSFTLNEQVINHSTMLSSDSSRVMNYDSCSNQSPNSHKSKHSAFSPSKSSYSKASPYSTSSLSPISNTQYSKSNSSDHRRIQSNSSIFEKLPPSSSSSSENSCLSYKQNKSEKKSSKNKTSSEFNYVQQQKYSSSYKRSASSISNETHIPSKRRYVVAQPMSSSNTQLYYGVSSASSYAEKLSKAEHSERQKTSSLSLSSSEHTYGRSSPIRSRRSKTPTTPPNNNSHENLKQTKSIPSVSSNHFRAQTSFLPPKSKPYTLPPPEPKQIIANSQAKLLTDTHITTKPQVYFLKNKNKPSNSTRKEMASYVYGSVKAYENNSIITTERLQKNEPLTPEQMIERDINEIKAQLESLPPESSTYKIHKKRTSLLAKLSEIEKKRELYFEKRSNSNKNETKSPLHSSVNDVNSNNVGTNINGGSARISSSSHYQDRFSPYTKNRNSSSLHSHDSSEKSNIFGYHLYSTPRHSSSQSNSSKLIDDPSQQSSQRKEKPLTSGTWSHKNISNSQLIEELRNRKTKWQ